jgi:peptidoglycan hydrolase-like protein with peptidoglycan-binding domain
MKLVSLNLQKTVGAIALTAFFLAASVFTTHAQTVRFTTQMDIGARGSQVTALQSYLATQTGFYPEGLVTGYYGSLTSAAIARFQANYGLPAVGRVGPLTLAKLNEVAGGGADTSAPVIFGVSAATASASATIHLGTNEMATARVFYASVPLILSESAGSGFGPLISGTAAMTDASFRVSHDIMLSNLSPNTTYFYVIEAVDARGNLSVSWPTTFRTAP